ncbi:hypothetical protein SDC9_04066 [bioreactor metagenome]|uniref:CBS domain-containing protein n=1 Tax=bioreactor metagenome TaxID=1076179 RepID=A0A644SXV2_9ZZZZ|nr:CBS domain-containing protein [Negativicutes bacterium]
MNAVTVLGAYYFSSLQGKAIYDAAGRKLGSVKDMAMRWDSASPQVVGIKYARKKHELIPIDRVENFSDKGLVLVNGFTEQQVIPLKDEDIYISKWLLDKQIIDLKGSRLVRVNDITLSWVVQKERRCMVLVAVDIGVRGLFRRLGLEFLFKRWENQLLGFEHIKPLEKRTSVLQLVRDKEQLGQLHPADIANILEEMDYKRRAEFIDNLEEQQAIDALSEMDLDTQVEIIEHMDENRASDILEEMPPDEAADILGELSEEKSQGLLNLMELEDAEEVRELMQYEEDTAGALMTTEYVSFFERLTVGQTINRLRELAPAAETIYYIFVTDEEEHLQGVLSLRELIVAAPETYLHDIMHTKVVAVEPDDNHQKVVDIINKYSLLAVPVVDSEGVILGIITVDDIIDIIIPDRGKGDARFWVTLRKRLGRGR